MKSGRLEITFTPTKGRPRSFTAAGELLAVVGHALVFLKGLIRSRRR